MTTVKLLASDFIGNDFIDNNDCPLARASTRLFGRAMVATTFDVIDMSGNRFRLESTRKRTSIIYMDDVVYGVEDYESDLIDATEAGFSDQVVIRELRFIDDIPKEFSEETGADLKEVEEMVEQRIKECDLDEDGEPKLETLLDEDGNPEAKFSGDIDPCE